MARNELGRLAANLDRFATAAFSRGPARAAEKVVSDLQKVGPAWSGEFSNSWVIATESRQTEGSRASGPAQKLSAPLLSGREFLFKPEVKYTIYNAAPYAAIAQDLEEGVFRKFGRPLKQPVSTGTRNSGIRGSVSAGYGDNESTAELDWFTTYLRGGAIDRAVQVSFNAVLPKNL